MVLISLLSSPVLERSQGILLRLKYASVQAFVYEAYVDTCRVARVHSRDVLLQLSQCLMLFKPTIKKKKMRLKIKKS